MVKIYTGKSYNPFFNTATEEFFFKNTSENILFVWRNTPSVFIGKHQNALSEINIKDVHKKNIPVIRRISGGGAVYHDLGNINFSLIFNADDKAFNIPDFIIPVVAFLKKNVAEVSVDKRNAIFVNGLKVSGTAQHIFKNRIIFHGTLLFKADLNNLNQMLENSGSKYADKAVKSIRSKVGNISDFDTNLHSVEVFQNNLIDFFKMYFDNSDENELSAEEIAIIESEFEPRYLSWEWNYGYSPNYSFTNDLDIFGIPHFIKIQIVKGIIQEVVLIENHSGFRKHEIEKLFIAKEHNFDIVKNVLNKNADLLCLSNEQIDTFVYEFF